MHMHAYNHLLTLTIATMTDRALHQPWVHVSSDLYENLLTTSRRRACQCKARRATAAERCSGGRCGGRPGCSGRWSSLHTRATASNGGGAYTRAGRVRGARWVAATAHGAAERRPSGHVACVWHACADLGARSGAREAPSVSEAGPGGLVPAWRCPSGAPRSLWSGPRHQGPKAGPVMHACACTSGIGCLGKVSCEQVLRRCEWWYNEEPSR